MSLLTRNDMLRELELLPIWQLRTPLPENNDVKKIVQSTKSEKASSDKSGMKIGSETTSITLSLVEKAVIVTKLPVFKHVCSEDGNWLFVMSDSELREEEYLFQNICKAIQIKVKPVELSNATVDVLKIAQPKLLISMGQTTTQILLKSTETLETLRGTLQKFEGIPLIATYDLAHLLANLHDKAKTWDDLCHAIEHLQGN